MQVYGAPVNRPTGSEISGKDKASRVPLGYFRGGGRKKWTVTLVVLAAVIVGVGASFGSGQWRALASPGRVHAAHARWENDCSVCHQPLKPTSSRNGLQQAFQIGPVSDQLCKNCHDGPPHHFAQEIAGDAGSCASCHADHRGRHAPLARSDDASCTRCHANMDAHLKDPIAAEYATKISRFDRDHPQFRLGSGPLRKPLGEATDPAKLKFNHKVHLSLGLRHADGDARNWTLIDIKDKALRERYRSEQPADRRGDGDPVKLDCASCHQLDAGDSKAKAGPGQNVPVRSSGAYLLPVTYAQACKACHPLTFDPALPGVEIPHHLQPAEVKSFLWGVYANREVAALKTKLAGGPALPGQNVSRAEKEARDAVNEKADTIDALLRQDVLGHATEFVFAGKTTCGLCHDYVGKRGGKPPGRVVPPGVKQVWFEHARFNHSSHRTMKCAECHAGAEKSVKNTDVLLPGVENCRTCHAPEHREGGKTLGGVRYGCATCHGYHNSKDPLAGVGAEARGVPREQRRTTQELLDGRLMPGR